MSRLIDADALRESIITRQTEMSYEDAWALTCVDNAPTIEPQKWIPCSEKLPEYEEYVLVTFIDKSTIDTKVMCVRRIEGFADWYWLILQMSTPGKQVKSLPGCRCLNPIRRNNMTKSEIYKAISDLIADSDGASIDYIIGVNDMGRYLAEQCKDAPSPEPQHQISEEWMDKLIEMVKQGNEVHLEFTPEETRIEVMPWKPFEYKCPYKGDKEC